MSRLQAGNNPDAVPTTDDLPGKLRMTLEQAQTFESRYDIIDAYQNDATGFSAVALRDSANPGRVVLAVRSTEIKAEKTGSGENGERRKRGAEKTRRKRGHSTFPGSMKQWA